MKAITCAICYQPITDLTKAAVVWIGSGTYENERELLVKLNVIHNLYPCCYKDTGSHVYWDHLDGFVRRYEWYTDAFVFTAVTPGWNSVECAMNCIQPLSKQDNDVPVRTGIRFDILKRDNYRCCLCGRSAIDGAILEVDHKTPRARGGSNHENNLWTLCFECNRGKSTKSIGEGYDHHTAPR